MSKNDLALNNQQWLICRETKQNQIKFLGGAKQCAKHIERWIESTVKHCGETKGKLQFLLKY